MLGRVDAELTVPDMHGPDFESRRTGGSGGLAGADVETTLVKRTFDLAPEHKPFRQGPRAMGTFVLGRIELTVEVEHRVSRAVHHDTQGSVRNQLARGTQFNLVRRALRLRLRRSCHDSSVFLYTECDSVMMNTVLTVQARVVNRAARGAHCMKVSSPRHRDVPRRRRGGGPPVQKTTVFARGTLGRAGARIQRFIKEVTGESAGGGQGAQPTAADTCGNLFCRGRNVPRETQQMSLGQPLCRARDTYSGNRQPVVVHDGRRDSAHTRLILFIVGRIAARADGGKLFLQGRGTHHRPGRAPFQLHLDDLLDDARRLECGQRLTFGRAVDGFAQTDSGGDAIHLLTLEEVHTDDAAMIENGKIDRLPGLLAQCHQPGLRFKGHVEPAAHQRAELKHSQTEAIAAGLFILLEHAGFEEGRGETMHRTLGQSQPLGQGTDSQFTLLVRERLHQEDGVRHR